MSPAEKNRTTTVLCKALYQVLLKNYEKKTRHKFKETLFLKPIV